MALDNTANYLQAAHRAIRWILQRQKSDGSLFDVEDGIGGYYKVPYALALAGHGLHAMRLLRWVERHHFTQAGDFRAPQRKATSTFHDEWPIYGNAWLIQGAHLVGRFDLSFRGAEFLLRHQVTGGGFAAWEQGKPFIEGVCTSWGGLAELTVGNLDSANKAAHCLCRLVEDQPDRSRFYFRMTTDGVLLTEVPPEAALAYYVDSTCDKQIYYQPGIMLIFLCQYYRATSDERVLAAARQIFDFTQRCAGDVYRYPPSGKLGVGCALLATITELSTAQQPAESVARYLLETQSDEGCWFLPNEDVYQAIENKRDPEIVTDITAEFATFLLQITSLLQL